jgi:putative hydrolase of the HAD superfamily
MKNYHHIFFDLDETLWDFRSNSQEALGELFDHFHLNDHHLRKELFLERYHFHNDFFWDQYRKGLIDRETLRIVRFQTTLQEFKIKNDELVKDLSVTYLEMLPNKKNLMEGTLDVLAYLQPKYHIHIITNGFEEVQLKKIKNSGLEMYFKYVITSERAGTQKPQPGIFKYAMQISNASLLNSIFIGDSLEADIKGAKAVGMDHIYFNAEKRIHHEDVQHEINHLTELFSLL